ncbi:hypothetical protein EMIT0P12_10528 [Pseudomonas sp. IT-P12]
MSRSICIIAAPKTAGRCVAFDDWSVLLYAPRPGRCKSTDRLPKGP